MGRRHILDGALADQLGKAVGFRNVLVRQYITVDDAVVIAALDHTTQFHSFVADISRWLTAQQASD